MKRKHLVILISFLFVLTNTYSQNTTVINIKNHYGDIVKEKKVIKNYTVVSSQEYRSLNSKYSNQLKARVKELLKKYPTHPIVQFRVENGNSNRDKIALYLDSTLRKDTLGYFPRGNVFMGSHPNTQIHVNCSQRNLPFVKDFVNALSVYIISEYTIASDLQDENFVIFYISGMPLFDSNGRVKVQ